jgi:hypothetical protein
MQRALVFAVLAFTVRLTAQNDSKETGIATFVPVSHGTRVTIVVTGEPSRAVQPANIHIGRCDSVERIRYSLNPVLNGHSTSVVADSLANLRSGAHVVVLQDSPASLRAAKEYKYVSCGPI